MKRVAYALLVITSFSAVAHDEDAPINDTAELLDWCKAESEPYFLANDVTPYNWTASWWSEGNTLHVKGGWRIDEGDVIVDCRIVKGAKRKYAVYRITR